ncbi:hypothetical protein Bbelb_292840 [Branchiostoma belcheri]|nr:hypothetical protein Bbelb_292840 [Branchiostoma belcheri]
MGAGLLPPALPEGRRQGTPGVCGACPGVAGYATVCGIPPPAGPMQAAAGVGGALAYAGGCARIQPSMGKVSARRKEGAARLAAADEAPAVPGARAGCPGSAGVLAAERGAGAAAARGLAAGTGRGDPMRRGRSPPSPEDQPVGGYECIKYGRFFCPAPICRSYLPGALNLADGDMSHLTPTTSPSANFIGLDREGFRDPAGRVYITPDDQPSFCYPADQAATPSEGSQRSTTGLEGGRSFAPPSEVGRAKGAQRRHRPGSSRLNGDGSPLPSACEYALRTRRSETRPPTLPAGASVVRVRDRKRRSGVAGSSALRLPRVRGQLYGAFPPLRQRWTWAVRMSPTVERRAGPGTLRSRRDR